MQTTAQPHTPAAATEAPNGPALLIGFITNAGITQSAFAERVSVSRGYVTELLNGTKRPSLPLAVRIEAETGNAVPAASWMMRAELEPVRGRSE